MSEKEAIGELARLIVGSNENAQYIQGQLMVLACGVYALVRTHPEPDALAAAFRSAWTRLGQWHADDTQAESLLSGISESLALMEGASRVPLHVRSPAVASPPDD